VKAFGHRPRSSITTRNIDEQLQAMLDTGCAPSSVNKYRSALMSMYTRLDGKSGANQVHDAKFYEARGQPYGRLTRVRVARATRVDGMDRDGGGADPEDDGPPFLDSATVIHRARDAEGQTPPARPASAYAQTDERRVSDGPSTLRGLEVLRPLQHLVIAPHLAMGLPNDRAPDA
jgi:hypothetical protein